jgi:branched-chain amino acid transport system substrate-binding protein
MKKRYVMYLLIVLAMVLAACQPAATPAPAAEQPAAEEEAAPAAEEEAAPAAEEEAAPAAGAPEECAADPLGCAVVEPGQTVKIGMGAPMTGDYSMFGIDISQAVSLALKQSGGIEGWEFELVAEDTQGSPEAGAAVASRFVTDPTMIAIAGHIFSGSSEAAMPIYEKAGFPMLSPSATNPPLTQQGSKVFNRTAFTDATQAQFAAKLMYEDLGYTKIAAMHDGTSYGQGLAEEVRKNFEAMGGEVVAFEAITPGEVDYIAPLSAVAALNPEAIYYGGTLLKPLSANQWQQAGLEVSPSSVVMHLWCRIHRQNRPQWRRFYRSFSVPPASSRKRSLRCCLQSGIWPRAVSSLLSPGLLNDVGNAHLTPDPQSCYQGCRGNLYFPRTQMVEAVRGIKASGLTGLISCDEIGECNALVQTLHLLKWAWFLLANKQEVIIGLKINRWKRILFPPLFLFYKFFPSQADNYKIIFADSEVKTAL